MRADSDNDQSAPAGDANARIAVGTRVRIHPRTDAESPGVIIEDFGEMPRVDVEVGTNQVIGPARRWAVALDNGTLAFVNSEQLSAE
ncbi:hypothetical protein [Mycobacterium shimoidei]|uniref:Uncharacterized protein n=1 Tax=Mycobacterium shimoidei TaxID=29313 RepID=A0A1E3TF08_MYCSH|nr:hypothetical protein [Mycobacterium shimoidei]MCV7259185.1 hypothetical protein [Mycobacterium shimoidei]ODR13022.1 hypothetical protein BHQ16_12215 [Mycobacterium shimoidei]ORW83376.1 hypothetical protein AWC26_02960 [Mycobacterium shimoidei]SRX95030.1 hypothetical protein MSP7336_03294 [Mycobacterium shimoidei]